MSDTPMTDAKTANKYICELEARLNERNDSATTWDWVMQSLKRNKDHAVIVRLYDDGNTSFLHGDPTKELESENAALRRDAKLFRQILDTPCNQLYISVNEHAANYFSAKEYIEDIAPDLFTNDPPEEVQKMKDSGTIWTVHIYPNTPVGFNVWNRSTLEAALDAARRET